jgi:nicotinate dehydrogenase subunit B
MSALENRPVEETALDIAERHGFTRAGFMKAGGALIIAVAFPAAAEADTTPGKKKGVETANGVSYPTLDPSKLKSWLAIQADGSITAFTGKVELGQGNQTALTQIIAEDLDVPFESITLIMGDTARTVDQIPTYGSLTIFLAGPQLREAAANGRAALVKMASDKLGVPVGQLTVRDGVVIDTKDSGNSISYGDLVHGDVLTQTIPGVKVDKATSTFTIAGATPKSVDDYTIVGQSRDRVDIPLKVKAEYQYVQDVKVDGMLHGRVIRPPALGAKLISVGSPPPGVAVVRIKDFLAVAAADQWTAIQAAKSLEAKWTDWAGLPDMTKLPEYLKGAPSTPQVIQHAGDIAKGLSSAGTTMTASYSTPVETHGALGPSCCIADVGENGATIHSGSQSPFLVQASTAAVLNLKPTDVHVISYPASGCYGRNGADPVCIDAALMSKALGAPVRVQWMRADEHGWDPKGPATTHDLRAGIDGGRVVAFDHEGWIPAQANTTLIGSVLAGDGVAEPVSQGGWAGTLPYNFQNIRLLSHNIKDIAAETNGGVGIISAWLRSPAQFQISFAEESFLDEVAASIKADPVEFRLRHLTDKRFIAVTKKVAEMANWETRPSPAPGARSSGKGTVSGRGIGISLRGGTYNADIAEVDVDLETGQVTVKKFWVTQDNGMTVNPRAVRLGIEAGIVQSTSRVLLEEVKFDKSAITSLDWISYPILTFEQAPEVEVGLVYSQHVQATGSGEPSCCPVPAAISNAIFDATGARVRTMPMTPAVVKAALNEVKPV